MKKSYAVPFLVILTIFASCKKEQLHWNKVVSIESHTTARLNRIAFLDNNTCIIGGGEKYEKAEVLISNDRGNTWEIKSFPEAGKGLYGLGMSPAGDVYLSGFDGKIVYSRGQTLNWQVSQIPDWRYYVAIAYPSNDTGVYIATSSLGSGTIVRVNENFQVLDTTGFNFALNDISFPSAVTGYATGYGGVVKTTDGGNTWNILNVKNDNFTSVYCINEDNVWACGYNGSIYHTTNGGADWEQVRNGNKINKPKYRLKDIVFKDVQHGWAVGEKGLIIYTSDGGANWQQYKNYTDTHLLSIAVTPDGNLIVTGEKGAIYKLYM